MTPLLLIALGLILAYGGGLIGYVWRKHTGRRFKNH